MAGAGAGNIGGGFGGGGMSGRGNGDAVFSGLEQGSLGVPVEIAPGVIGFANPLTGEVTVPGESFGLPAGSTVTVSPSDPNSAIADVATPAGTMTMGLDKALGLFGGGDQGFGSIMSGGEQNLGDFGSQAERDFGAPLAPNPDPGTGYDFGLAGPATGQFGGPGFSIGTFGPGDVAIAMDEAGLDPGFNGIEGTQTKGEIAADFAASMRGGSRLGGPSDEEGDPATNAFDTAALDGGINGAVGFGPGASDHEIGVNAAMDAARGNSQINAGDLGLQVDPGTGSESGAYGRNIGAIDQALGEIAVASGTNQVAADLGTSMADIAAGGRGQTGNAFDSDLADISAAQAAREGTIADLNTAADAALGRNGGDESGINVGDSTALDGVIGGENAVGFGFGGADFGSGFGNLSGGSETAAFGADGLSDGPGMSFGGGDVGVDIAAGNEGIDMGGRVGDFANSNIGTTTGENAFDSTVAESTGPSAGEGFDSGDSAETAAAGGFDGGTGMGGTTGGGVDITGGVADMGMGGLGDGGGREAGIGGGFAGIGDMGSGNAFDGGSQTANDSSSSASSSSGVASGGSSGRGGRGQGGDDISGGWGWDGGGWDGSADGISGGFGREGGGEGRAAADGTGGGFGWG